MYSRQILAVLGSVFVLFATAGFSFQERTAFEHSGEGFVAAVANPMNVVDEKLETLNRKVHSRIPASEKVALLKETLTSIQDMRKSSPLMTIDKEVYMDYATESLEHVALDQSFSASKCSYYKAKISIDFEPYAGDKPTHPALLRSYNIIDGICA